MKKYIYLILAGFTFSAAQSQELVDALRYSQDNLNGSARYRAMSGAFGALGGDLSSLNANPAGSAVFNNNQLAFTFSNVDIKNKSNYFGNSMTGKDNSFDLNQAGAVFVFNNYSKRNNWTKIAVAINYERTNNFNNSIISAGTNPTNSVGDYFLSYANANPSRGQLGIPLRVIKNNDYYQLNYTDQQAFLGYEGYIINPQTETDENTVYTSNVPQGGNYYQENTITSEGYNGKLSFNAATSYKDKLYLGLTLNSHFTDFRQNTLFYEDNDNINNNNIDLVSTSFENSIYTYGSGFSFQLGAIAKLNDEVRVGLSYESPTWNRFNDEVRQNLVSSFYDTTENDPPLSFTDIDSNQTTLYDTYKLKTPGKITGSIAYVINKKGLISLDYGYKDYSNIKYSMERDTRNTYINSDISDRFRGTSEIRLGGEYKIERLSLRAGYRFEGSPYKDKTTVGDLNGYSTGLGYDFGGTKIDVSYAYAKRNSQQGFFSQGFTDGANIDGINNTISLSLLFEL